MTPNYLATFRRAVLQLERGEKSEISEKSTPLFRFSRLFRALCPPGLGPLLRH